MKVDFKCWTWGMEGVEIYVNNAIDIINTKDWTKEEVDIIKEAFKHIEEYMEASKESAWGEDA